MSNPLHWSRLSREPGIPGNKLRLPSPLAGEGGENEPTGRANALPMTGSARFEPGEGLMPQNSRHRRSQSASEASKKMRHKGTNAADRFPAVQT